MGHANSAWSTTTTKTAKYKRPRGDKGHVTLLLSHNTLTRRETVSWASSGWGMDPLSPLHWLSSSNAQPEHAQKQRRAYNISYTQHSSITMWVTLHAAAQTENSQATVPDLGHPCNSCTPGCGTHPHFHLKSPWLRDRHHTGDGKPLNWPPAHNHIQRGHTHSYPCIHVCSFPEFNACTSSSSTFARLTNSPGVTEGMWSLQHADILHSHGF